MDRLIAPNSVPFGSADTYPVSGTPQYATDGNPVGPVPATLFPAYAWNMIQDEIRYVITQAGLTPAGSNWTQLFTAIQALIAAGESIVTEIADTGTANALVITLSPAPASLAAMAGRLLAITKSAAANTGAVTINPNGLGATAVTRSDGSALPSGWWAASAVGLILCTGTGFIQLNIPAPGLLAPLASPALTGTPTVPTAPSTTNTIQAASTAFVQAALPLAWTDVTGSRAYGTVYTNSTGKPMVVSAWGVSSGIANLSGSVGGVQVALNCAESGNTQGILFIVPAGATYEIQTVLNSVSLAKWMEMT